MTAVRIAAFRDRFPDLAANQAPWTTHLLDVLQGVRTVQEVHDWVDALTPALCEACPDLLLRLSDRLRHLLPLPSFTPKDVRLCVALCLDAAWKAKQAAPVWADLCAGIHQLSPAAMRALLACLREQRARSQLPGNGDTLIRHVKAVRYGMSQLAELGYGIEPGTTRPAPVDAFPGKLEDDGIIAIDTRTQRNAIAFVGGDALNMVLGHLVKELGIDWMQPELLGPAENSRRLLRNLALVSKQFYTRFSPMQAHHTWMVAEADTRLDLQFSKEDRLDALIKQQIHQLVDLKARKVASMLPCAPGVAYRRLDLMLRALLIGLTRVVPGQECLWLAGAYLKLHDRAVLQLASRSQGMSPCFAQHIDLSALPLQMLAMVDRMLGFEGTRLSLLAFTVLSVLPAYPQDVQAQALISMLSLSVDEDSRGRILIRLGKLMHESDSWSNAASHAWLGYQWVHLDSLLALIEDPHTAHVPDGLLASLRQHHGVGDSPTLLIDDPFGERYVLWTIADIRVLAALCQRAEASDERKPPELVNCLVDLLRQLCSLSASTHKFAASTFMAHFPTDILLSAFLQLTAREQGVMLVRVYAPDAPDNWSDHMELIEFFAMNERIDRGERKLVLTKIQTMPQQDLQCREFARGLLETYFSSPPNQ
ncbi:MULTISPECIES: hypothetical protein [unclassified Variovorax]|uniref:hypothetical protein n=1 Tax=unclassified Variovorax TaxID=663243 RepID=UPI00076C07CC|nr:MULTISPECIES: hypothetical protein [unclassified Variovorax]KWT89268.1 hypothetical protein APY03_3512 [Variovorax sp. WDL1]